jgi:hypothetical protein
MEDKELKEFLEFVMKKTLPLCKNADTLVSDSAIKLNKRAHELHKKLERNSNN